MDGVKVFGFLTLSIPLFFIIASCYYSKKQQQQQLIEQEEEEEELKEEELKAWSWAELDRNLLGEIVGRLCLTDQARFRAVCTDWLVAAHPIINKTKCLPWLGCKHPYTPEFHMYDPLLSPDHLASRQIVSWSDLGIKSLARLVTVHNAKHSWVIVSVGQSNLLFWTRRFVFLLSPFTKTIIALPKFDYPKRFIFLSTFSTRPDSQDCVFCMVNGNQGHKIHVLTCRNGDKEWTAKQFNRHPDFRPHIFFPHIISGILYIFSSLGQVASYNILNGEFNFDRLLQDEFIVQNSSSRTFKSFVLNGELMILCFNQDVGKDAVAVPGQQFIRRYDRLLKVWIPVTTLADYALFFGTRFINVSLVNTKDDMTFSGVFPNMVYRFFDGGCLVYSIEDGQLVQSKSINSNLSEDGGVDIPEYSYNYAFPESCVAYWLETPGIRSSSNNSR